MMQTFTDHLFTTSTFNKPLVIKDKDAILTLVCRLILLEPGTISIAPEAGVGLVSKYRYMNSETIVDLEENIEDQINRFLPYFTQVDVNISLQENKILLIELDIDDSIYTLRANISKNNEVTLTELYNG